MSWRDAIVPTPTSVSAVGGAPGSLPAGIYGYRIVARRPAGQGTIANSLPSSEVTAVASGGAVTVSWGAVADAAEYQVYARSPAGSTQYWTVSSTTFVHNGGTPGRAGTAPAAATAWQVKNLFELKNARRVRIEYNLFENNWKAAQAGYAVLFTPRNQDGKCSWCVVEQVEFIHNELRNIAGGFNITGYDNDGVSKQTNAITIQDNFIHEMTTTLGGSAWPFLIGEEPRDIIIDRNTIDSDGTTLLYAYGRTTGQGRAIAGFRFTNNAARHREYGINGADASTGTLTFQMYFPSPTVTGNWLSGGSSSRYPAGNRFEEPFDVRLPTGPSVAAQGPGANLWNLLAVMENVRKGLMTEAPERPRSVRVIF
jgi:hypothetical protein